MVLVGLRKEDVSFVLNVLSKRSGTLKRVRTGDE